MPDLKTISQIRAQTRGGDGERRSDRAEEERVEMKLSVRLHAQGEGVVCFLFVTVPNQSHASHHHFPNTSEASVPVPMPVPYPPPSLPYLQSEEKQCENVLLHSL